MAERTKQRIVVKVGTSTLTHDSGALDLRSMEHLVRTLADLHGMGHEVILSPPVPLPLAPPSWDFPNAPGSCG